MPTITASGLGSGLDLKSLVSQLVAAERQPVAQRLDSQQAKASARLSALGVLKSALSVFRDALAKLGDLGDLQRRAVTVSPEELITVTATSAAATGTYDVEVLALATSQKLASGPFAAADTVVGTGTLAITVNGVTDSIAITAGNNTLAGIRDAINKSTGNPGVRASIVTANDGAHLLISGTERGSSQTITINALEAGSGLEAIEFGAGTLNALTEKQSAADAQVKIDGYTVTSPGNSLKNAIDGVTINLNAAEPGTTIAVSIDRDEAAATGAVQKFVEAYNSLAGTIAKLTAYNTETKTAGPLLGDASTRSLQAAIRQVLVQPAGDAGNAFSTLAEIGIQTTAKGTLSFDSARLGAAIDLNFDAVGNLFAADGKGVSDRLTGILDGLLATTSALSNRENNLKDRLANISDQRESLDRRMEQVRTRYQKQFDAMDRLVNQLNSSGSALLQALAKL